MKGTGIIERLFKTYERDQDYYVHGSGLIRIPIGRMNEIPKVIQEFHEQEAAITRLATIARR